MKAALSMAIDNPIEQFLKLDLSAGFTALMAIDRVVEAIEISPDRIVPLPHIPPTVKGIYNWRGEILWILDLALLLGLKSPSTNLKRRRHLSMYQGAIGTYSIAIVSDSRQSDRLLLGLVVEEVSDMEWGYRKPIGTSMKINFDGAISDFIDSYCINNSPENLPIINIDALFDCPKIHSWI
jgi:positive phototaxis protein PixI